MKEPGIRSLKEGYLQGITAKALEGIAAARINGSIIIERLEKSIGGCEGAVQYMVETSQAEEVTKVELLSPEGEILSSSAVYIPVSGPVLVKHRIEVQEGGI